MTISETGASSIEANKISLTTISSRVTGYERKDFTG